MRTIYFDNAATSFPKPEGVARAVANTIENVGANPGRGSHTGAVDAGRILLHARRAVAALVGAADPMRVILTPGATFALNTAILGLLREGGHCVTTSMEHNAVLRPLSALGKRITLTVAPASREGVVDSDDIRRALRPDTKLVVVNHASNVNGVVQDVAAIGALLTDHPAAYVVDAAQSAGCTPLDMQYIGCDLLAVAGHKGPLGPMGVGALVMGARFDAHRLPPLQYGGTGSRSSDTVQPDFMPDKYESGTMNTPGFAGLVEGIAWVREKSVEAIAAHEDALRRRFIEGARELGLQLYGDSSAPATGVVSFTIPDWSVSAAADALSETYGVSCRQGLHCAPRAHRTLGSFPEGTLRFGFGPFNTEEEIDYALKALKEMRDA